MEAISSWFTRAEAPEIAEFSFGTAIEIASRSANVTAVVSDEPGIAFNGKHLTSFVDVMYVLFENAASKSGLPREKLQVTASLCEEPAGSLTLRVANNCEMVADVGAANAAIDYYRDAYGNDDVTRTVIQQNGGSGIFRIWRCLSKDIGIKHTIEFGYESEGLFVVTLKMQEPTGVLYHESIAR